jgi:hypothetical protein
MSFPRYSHKCKSNFPSPLEGRAQSKSPEAMTAEIARMRHGGEPRSGLTAHWRGNVGMGLSRFDYSVP